MISRDKQRIWQRLNLLILLMLGLMVLVWSQRPDEKVRVVVCDVGQGDAILVSWKNYQLLVDGGPDNSVLSCLGKNMAFWDRRIEVVAMTHPQADHMTGLIEVLRRYEVGELIAAEVVNDTPEFWQLRQVIKEKGIKTKELVAGDRLRLGEAEIKVLWPKQRSRGVLGASSYQADVNEVSLVLLGSLGKFDWLLTGDISEKEERQLLEKLKEIEVLKVAHHGSRYSSSQEFLEKLSPELAMISVGEGNWFGHPTEAVLERLAEAGARVLRTDKDGMIRIVSDGQSWWQD